MDVGGFLIAQVCLANEEDEMLTDSGELTFCWEMSVVFAWLCFKRDHACGFRLSQYDRMICAITKPHQLVLWVVRRRIES